MKDKNCITKNDKIAELAKHQVVVLVLESPGTSGTHHTSSVISGF